MVIKPPVPQRPGRPHRRSRTALAVALAAVTVVGGCGSAAWYVGLFTSDGRFEELDACTLLPPPGDRLVGCP